MPEKSDLLVSRVRIGIAVAGFLMAFAYTPLPGTVPLIPFRQMLLVAVACLVASSLFGDRLVAERPEAREQVRIVQLVADMVLAFLAAHTARFDAHLPAWALAVLPILEGAVLLELQGAMVVWAANAAASLATRSVALGPDGFGFTRWFGLQVILAPIAVALGYLSLEVRRQAWRAIDTADEVAGRADRLGIVVDTARRMVGTDADQVLSLTVDAVRRLGFDAAEVCRLESHGWRVTHAAGLDGLVGTVTPASYGLGSQPGTSGPSTELLAPDDPRRRCRSFVSTPLAPGLDVPQVLVGRQLPGAGLPDDLLECFELVAAQASASLAIGRRYEERWKLEEQLAKSVSHDRLTGLPNHIEALAHLDTVLSHDVVAGVAVIDLDHFAQVIAQLGHQAGDDLIKQVANRLVTNLSSTLVTRLSGDEFVIVLGPTADEQSALALLDRVPAVFGEPFVVSEHLVTLTVSGGVTLAPADGLDPETLLNRAEEALASAKAGGRNRMERYHSHPAVTAPAHRWFANDLERALVRNELTLVYQPEFEAISGQVEVVEALVRWRHPDKGVLGPDAFVPAAEDLGLINQLSRWVIREACSQIGQWQRGGYPPVAIAVNISASLLHDPELVGVIDEALGEHGLHGQWLQVEVTESAAVGEARRATARLESLRERGVRIALDDFGTGHSTIARLRSIPLDVVKIDRSFVSEIDERAESPLVGAMVAMAHSLSLSVVAEGVETLPQLAGLRRMGCDLVQGHLLQAPASPVDLDPLLRAGRLAMPATPPGGHSGRRLA